MPKVNSFVLKELRRARGWSLEEMAERSAMAGLPKLDPQTIWRAEQGRQTRNHERTILQLAWALQIDPSLLKSVGTHLAIYAEDSHCIPRRLIKVRGKYKYAPAAEP